MKFKELSKYLKELDSIPSRNEMTQVLAELLKESSIDDVEDVVNLSLGQLAPSYKGIVSNIAERMMVQILAQAYDKDSQEVKEMYKKSGDLGDTAHELCEFQGKGLVVKVVHERLMDIATDEGGGSQERKIEKTANLLKDLDRVSSKYVVRITLGKLRLGFSDKTILDALSWMENGDKSAKKELDYAYQVLPDVGLLASKVKKHGIEKATKDASPVVGIPVLPMLAQRIKSPKEMIEKMNEVSIEPKLDGLRILIHYKAGKNGFVRAYTRNMNETSWMFPELKEVKDNVKAEEFIIDSEAVGVDPKRKGIANFQATMTRRRKHEIGKYAESVPIQFFAFDILAKDKKNLMNKTYLERRKILDNTLKYGKLFGKVDYVVTNDPVDIGNFNKDMKKDGFEGIMVKRVDSEYVPGRTGWRWVKMKEAEDSHAKLVDTIDGVVMGYSVGRGKRASFGLGQFLVGVVDGGKVVTTTKVGTGLTDDQFKNMEKLLKKYQVDEKPDIYDAHKNYTPDYWVKPEVIVEIAADDITKSPTHTSGFALRFPRLVKVRDDKSVKNATTVKELEKFFDLQ
jgi:DNA ligase-1